jgi:hypothetical protein
MKKIKITGTPSNWLVEIDGVPLPAASIDLHMDCDSLPELAVRAPLYDVGVYIEGNVKLDEMSRHTVLALGWTPPDTDESTTVDMLGFAVGQLEEIAVAPDLGIAQITAASALDIIRNRLTGDSQWTLASRADTATDGAKPEMDDAEFEQRLRKFIRMNPAEFETWLRKRSRTHGGNLFPTKP